MKGYYFITDARLSRAGNLHDVKAACACGVAAVQYRDKYKNTQELYEEASKLRAICKRAIFIINDRVDIALAVNADGVHLGKEDLPYSVARKILGKKRIIGLTVHNLKEAQAAEERGADYIGVSPIFSTRTKQDAGKPCGPELIRFIKRHVSIPVVAIGGIDLGNAKSVVEAGADCISAISAVVTREDVKGQIRRLQGLF